MIGDLYDQAVIGAPYEYGNGHPVFGMSHGDGFGFGDGTAAGDGCSPGRMTQDLIDEAHLAGGRFAHHQVD